MIPSIHVARIPRRIFPFISFTTRNAVISTPIIAIITVIPASLVVAIAPSTPCTLLYPSIENSSTRVAPPITILAF